MYVLGAFWGHLEWWGHIIHGIIMVVEIRILAFVKYFGLKSIICSDVAINLFEGILR